MHISVKQYAESIKNEDFSYHEVPVDNAYWDNGIFYKDKTAICAIHKDKFGNINLLITDNGLSPSITPYLPELEAVFVGMVKSVTKVPQVRSSHPLYHQFDPEGLYKIFEKGMLRVFEGELTVFKCHSYIKQYDKLMELAEIVEITFDKSEKKLLDNYYKTAKEHITEVDSKVKAFMKNHSFRECIDIAFFNADCSDENEKIDENFRALLRSGMNETGDYSFLKVMDDGEVYTSDLNPDGTYRHIMSNQDAIDLASTFNAGKLRHGMRFGDFTIMSVHHGWVKISCNKYSPEMINLILDDAIKYKEKHEKK